MSSDPRAPKQPYLVRVIVRESEDPTSDTIHDKTGDYNERYFRDWIDKTQWWAMRDGKKCLTMYPVTTDA